MPQPIPAPFAIYGTAIYVANPTYMHLFIHQQAFIIIDTTGTITHTYRAIRDDEINLGSIKEEHNLTEDQIIRLTPGQFFIPGFVDTHNHAPQWMQRGLGQGMHILDWLSEVTFPNEAKFADEGYARTVYPRLVKGMLRQGVTTASYYGSLHGEATRILADTCLEMGQRAFIGKCNMDRNSPDYYRDASSSESLEVTEECITHIRKIDPEGHLLNHVLTPRFAISCTPELLQGLGEIAKQNPDLPIQTHFNEAQQEIDATLDLFPAFTNEVDLYSHYNLLTPRTILAHCTIMTDDETQRLKDLDCGVAHCPTANMTVGGGFMAAPVRDFLRRRIKVGLGTDSGGGFSSSMLDAMRHALIASFAREAATGGKDKGLSIEEVFYMATLGGATVMGLGDKTGSFMVGKDFDVVVVDVTDRMGGVNAPMEEGDSDRTMFDKFIMTGDDRNIVKVFVKGKVVYERTPPSVND